MSTVKRTNHNEVMTVLLFYIKQHTYKKFVHLIFHSDIRDSQKYDTFQRKQAVLFINLLGKELTKEISG